jgi:hypothetical protein
LIQSACLSLCFIASAVAQGPTPNGGGSGGGKVGLATQDRVAKELGIAADAAKMDRLRKLSEIIANETRDGFKKLRESGQTSDEDRMNLIRSVRDKHDAELKQLLTEKEFSRLQQIDWQIRGAMALSDPDLAKALDLTQEQQDKLNKVIRDFVQKQQDAFKGKVNINEIKKKVDEWVIERDNAAAEILSKSQQEKRTTLLGPVFDLSDASAAQPNNK